jgi:NADH-quinone oxidoreductase subunit N
MMMTWADVLLLPARPEIAFLIMLCAILLADLFVSDERKMVTYSLSVVALLVAGGLTLLGLNHQGLAFNGMFLNDFMGTVLRSALYFSSAALLVYSRGYLIKRGLFRGEYYILMLFAVLGMALMISSVHLLMLYIGLELLSLALYAMIALDRDNPLASEAAIKYFILAAVASGFLLYGFSLIYGATGNLSLGYIFAHGFGDHAILVQLGLIFVVAGLAFKLGAVPFHMWLPDVYQGSSTATTIILGSVTKLAAFGFMARILQQGLGFGVDQWSTILGILALLSMFVGNVVAIAQTNLKRMLAYSTVAQMGFFLLGFVSGTTTGLAASMFYALTYALTALAGFGLLMILSRTDFDCQEITDLQGLNQRSPVLAFMMLLVMFSMAGIPPLVGFYAKFSVLSALVATGTPWMLWLAIAAVLMSLIGAFYYLRIVKTMYFDESTSFEVISADGPVKVLFCLNGAALLLLGIFPSVLIELCLRSLA